jgi:hypothetical protein
MTTAHAFLAGVVAVMSFTRVRRAIALTLVGALVVGVALPPPAQAQIGIGAVLAAASAVPSVPI